MKRNVFEISFKVLVVLGLIVVVFMHRADRNSVVYVDAIKLMSGYKGMSDARKSYDVQTASWKRNVDSLRTELQGSISDYQAKEKSLSASEKALTEKLLQAKEDQFLTYQKAISEKLQQADQELTGKVLTKVNDYIKQYGEAHGYDIILAATQYGNIVYARPGKDITNDVLEGLNSAYAK